MPQKCKTPAGISLPLSTPLAIQAQFLIAAHRVRPELPITSSKGAGQ